MPMTPIGLRSPRKQIVGTGFMKLCNVANCLLKIGRLQLKADAFSAHFNCGINLAPNAQERRQNHVAWIAPKIDATLDNVQLQRGNMLLVFFVTSRTVLQGARLIYVHPDWRCVALPNLNRIPITPVCVVCVLAAIWLNTVANILIETTGDGFGVLPGLRKARI